MEVIQKVRFLIKCIRMVLWALNVQLHWDSIHCIATGRVLLEFREQKERGHKGEQM